PILGLSLPTWSLVAFVVAFVPLALSLARNRRRFA
ncbi:MAG TPA: disulfide bond formation protein B, partial [Paraburkholderia sp.]|nr:disulfide bond formation protein B [Paraburkholderia sp.]